MKTPTTTTPTEGWHQCLVLAFKRLKYIRFGAPYWTHRYRWLYLPWEWSRKKSAHGGWFFLTWRTPIEMFVGVENLARWQNKRTARRRQNVPGVPAAAERTKSTNKPTPPSGTND